MVLELYETMGCVFYEIPVLILLWVEYGLGGETILPRRPLHKRLNPSLGGIWSWRREWLAFRATIHRGLNPSWGGIWSWSHRGNGGHAQGAWVLILLGVEYGLGEVYLGLNSLARGCLNPSWGGIWSWRARYVMR